jgi:hypothetical protein
MKVTVTPSAAHWSNSMTDFRTLCAELVDCLEKANWPLRHKTVFGICLDDARAALTQPEPQGPTDEELVELFNENDWNYISPETFLDIARSVLELR